MLSPAEIRARFERLAGEVGPDVTIVAATKYVSVADMAVVAEAGIPVVGENRAQDLQAKHAVYGDTFRWHFIGRLQSNKVKILNGTLRARPLARLALGGASGWRFPRSCRSTSPARARRAASSRTRSPTTCATASAASRRCRPAPARPRSRGRGSAVCASSRTSTVSTRLSMGTTQDYRVAVEERASLIRVGSVLFL